MSDENILKIGMYFILIKTIVVFIKMKLKQGCHSMKQKKTSLNQQKLA